MNSKLMLIVGGALAIVCAWLPWASLMGISVNGFQDQEGLSSGLILVILGALIAVMGFMGKKWSAIVAILLSLCVAAIGVYYFMEFTKMEALGYGIYVMLGAGIIGVIGGVMGLKGKGTTVA